MSRPSILALVVAVLIASAPGAAAEVFYASSDGREGYIDADTKVSPGDAGFRASLDEALAEAKRKMREKREGHTIRLLTTAPFKLTEFRASPCSFEIKDWAAHSEAEGLKIEGVVRETPEGRRWFTQITGLPYEEIKLGDRCQVPRPLPPLMAGLDERLDPLDFLETLISAEARVPMMAAAPALAGRFAPFAVSPKTTGERVHCFTVLESAHVTFEGLAFKDCWLPAIHARDSHDIALRNSFIQGSSLVFAATATRSPLAYNYTIEDNLWIQDVSGFGQPSGDCAGEPRETEAPCPGDIWHTVPWGAVHETSHGQFNGAMFGSIDIHGRVRFARNRIVNAYNGLRMKAKCGAKCPAEGDGRINVDVDVLDNQFINVRDNAVEPEGHASNWHIAGNLFIDTYAAISLDDVSGGPIYVYGNRGRFDDVPEGRCVDSPEHARAMIVDYVNDRLVEPRWDYDPLCRNHQGGTLFKLGASEIEPALADLYVFHNSWVTKSPVFQGVTTGAIRHWNNAIELKGCGTSGNPLCRTYPAESARGFYFATPDGESLFFNNFSFGPDMANGGTSTPHIFDHDAINREFPLYMRRIVRQCPDPGRQGLECKGFENRKLFADSGKDDFSLIDSEVETGGCKIAVEESGAITCSAPAGPGPAIGALDADGKPYPSPFTCAMPNRRWSDCR